MQSLERSVLWDVRSTVLSSFGLEQTASRRSFLELTILAWLMSLKALCPVWMSGKFEGINTLFKCVSISKMLRASRLHKIIECISIPEWIEDCFFFDNRRCSEWSGFEGFIACFSASGPILLKWWEFEDFLLFWNVSWSLIRVF